MKKKLNKASFSQTGERTRFRLVSPCDGPNKIPVRTYRGV